jgi:hypothetical protein
MTGRKCYRHDAPLRKSEKWKPFQTGSIDDSFKILNPRLEREFANIPIGEPISSRVVPYNGKISGEPEQQVTEYGQLPVIFQVPQPMRRPDQRRAGPNGCIG